LGCVWPTSYFTAYIIQPTDQSSIDDQLAGPLSGMMFPTKNGSIATFMSQHWVAINTLNTSGKIK